MVRIVKNFQQLFTLSKFSTLLKIVKIVKNYQKNVKTTENQENSLKKEERKPWWPQVPLPAHNLQTCVCVRAWVFVCVGVCPEEPHTSS